MQIVPRADWRGSAPALGHAIGRVDLVIIHHTRRPHVAADVSAGREMAHLNAIDVYHAEQGWTGIGYNFLVFQSGRVYEGRGWQRSGAHTVGQNSQSVGICCVIDGTRYPPTLAAVDAVRELIGEGIRLLHLAPGYRLAGHGDFVEKDCPGAKVREVFPRLRAVPASDPATPVLRIGARGPAVKYAQRLLGLPPRYCTGAFGVITQERLRAFQREHGLADDGICGPKSWAALLAGK